MQETGGATIQMLPLWFHWLFATGAIVLLLVGFVALWVKLAKIENRIDRLPGDEPPLMQRPTSQQDIQ